MSRRAGIDEDAIGLVGEQLIERRIHTTIRPTRELRRALEIEAAKRRMTLTDFCCELLERGVNQLAEGGPMT